jgi:hypothetical protein
MEIDKIQKLRFNPDAYSALILAHLEEAFALKNRSVERFEEIGCLNWKFWTKLSTIMSSSEVSSYLLSVNSSFDLRRLFSNGKSFMRYLQRTSRDYLERVAELCYVVTGRLASSDELFDLYPNVFHLVLLDKLSDHVKFYVNDLFDTVYGLESPVNKGFGPCSMILPKTLRRWISLKKGNSRFRASVRQGFFDVKSRIQKISSSAFAFEGC